MRFRWQQYRGFEDTGWVALEPFTMLLGANNVGKTSLYSPLLLLKQTLNSKNQSTSLLSEGEIFNAGRFADFVRNHDTAADVVLSLDLADSGMSEARQILLDDIPEEDLPAQLDLIFGVDPQERVTRTVLRRYQILNADDKILVRRQRTSTGKYSQTGRLVPSRSLVEQASPRVARIYDLVVRDRPDHFMFETSLSSSFLSTVERLGRNDDNETPEQRQASFKLIELALPLFQVQQAVSYDVQSFLRSISYIGPLRAMPKRTYRLSAEPPSSVGTDGEFAPEILYRDKEDGAGDLVRTVDDFLEKCGYGSVSFKTTPDGDAFSLHIGGEAGPNLVDCGMGLSQLLPLVTQICAAKPGSLSIVQQPEIHLNPALQVMLMDLLVNRLNDGCRVVVETHSEHLLLRLRRLVAEGTTSGRLATILYLESIDGKSQLREIDLSETGRISDDWPVGFFQEQMQDTLLLAKEQARRAREAAADA